MSRTLALSRGALCVSIDVELLWGVWDHVSERDVLLCKARERPVVHELLASFREYDVPATWAIVGRLVDDHPGFDGLRGPQNGWHAPDIVDAIAADPTRHEIGSHSYAHLYFGELSAEAARQELQRVKRIHESRGLELKSFVFPRNDVAHLDELRAIGVRVYRSTDAGLLGWTDRHAPRFRPAANLLDKAIPFAPPVVHPVVRDDGLVELPTSLLFIGRNGARRVVRPAAFAAKIRRGLDRATAEGGVFHLWFHPSNFYFDGGAQLTLLKNALAYAAHLRDRGQLDIRTLGSFAA